MPEHKFVPKGWGWEEWIVNKSEYCGKKLFFKKGKRCSVHYHKLKDETFYVSHGEMLMRYADISPELYDDKISVQEIVLKSGDSFPIPRGRIHQVIALEDTEVIEFSTEHFDSDSYRIIRGD